MNTYGYVIGIDGGTESIRVGIFDLSGNPILFISEKYNTFFNKPGWAVQDPEEWEISLKKAIKNALNLSGLDSKLILGISMTATIGTIAFLNIDHKNIEKAILWMDVRATKQFSKLKAINHPALKLNPTAEWPIPKIMWVKENMPDVYKSTSVILEYTSWLLFKMTGKIIGCLSNAVSRWFYNVEQGGYPFDLYETLGLGDLKEKLPGKTEIVGEVAGYLDSKFAQETGLPAGIPVAAGCPDGISAMIGLNAIKPGKPLMICGTSHVHLIASYKEIHTKGIIGSYSDAILKGIHLLEGGQVTTGAVLKWYKDNFLHKYYDIAKQNSLSIYEYLDTLASEISIGSNGLIILEYFQGNRTPYQDPYARGVVWGLSLQHTPVHIYRAILEGVAFGTRNILETIKNEGLLIEKIIACGGMTNSKLWLKIHADVCNIPIALTEVQEASVLGAAIVAAKAAGVYRTLEEAAENMVRERTVIYPNPKENRKYNFYYDLYKRTYPNLKSLMKKMALNDIQNQHNLTYEEIK